MPSGNITNNYLGALGSYAVIQNGMDKYILVYNDQAGTITNGDVYFLSFLKDADSASPSYRPTLDVPATTAIYRQVVVVNNFILGKTTILDTEWGFVQIGGYCPDINTSGGSVAIDEMVQGSNGLVTAVDDSAAYTTDSFGILATAVFSTTHFGVVLFGTRSLIG